MTVPAGLRKHWRTALGAGVGAAAGALYARFVGCGSGTCFITSHVSTAALFFGVTGALVGLPDRRAGRSAEGGSKPA